MSPTSVVRYQLKGAGKKPAVARVFHKEPPDVRAWLERCLGALARFEVIEMAAPMREDVPSMTPEAEDVGTLPARNFRRQPPHFQLVDDAISCGPGGRHRFMFVLPARRGSLGLIIPRQEGILLVEPVNVTSS